MICINGSDGSNKTALKICYTVLTNFLLLYLGTGSSWTISGQTIGRPLFDQWVHRAVVRSGDTIYAFENGTLFKSLSCENTSISVEDCSLFVGKIKKSKNGGKVDALIDEVRIHVGVSLWTADFTPPSDEKYIKDKLELIGSANFSFTADIELIFTKDLYITNGLKVWLPFDLSATQDLYGNRWKGVDIISENNGVYTNAMPYEVFNSDFTLHFWVTYHGSETDEGNFFSSNYRFALRYKDSKVQFRFYHRTAPNASGDSAVDVANLSELKDNRRHLAIHGWLVYYGNQFYIYDEIIKDWRQF